MNYANIKDAKEGDSLVADGGFTCMSDGQVAKVYRTDEGRLAIPCSDGAHLLDGQIDDRSGALIGLSPVRER